MQLKATISYTNYDNNNEIFGCLLGFQTVGVQDDGRIYNDNNNNIYMQLCTSAVRIGVKKTKVWSRTEIRHGRIYHLFRISEIKTCI